MWLLKLFISVLIIPLSFCIILGYFWLISKIFRLEDDDFGYSFPIGGAIILFVFLVYDIYNALPF